MTTWKNIILGLVILARAISTPVLAADTNPAAATAPNNKQHALRHILIGESEEAVQKLSPSPNGGFVIISPGLELSDRDELIQRLASSENQLIQEQVLAAIGQTIQIFARERNYPAATISIPTQSIAEGGLRIVLTLGPAGKSHLLRQILIGDSVEAAQKLSPQAGAGFVVISPTLAFLDTAELTKRLAAGENQLIQERLLAAIAQVIENYARQSDFPVSTAVIPSQNIVDGEVRVAVLLGKLRHVKVEGNRWFSESLLREKLRLEQGETLRVSELDRAIGWANNNPFRRVRVQLLPVPNTDEADLIVAVQEALPLRLTASYDNAGNDILGNNRYIASVTYANLWGRDHQASYQFITTNLGPSIYQGHGFDYRVPLPWRHHVQVSGLYLRARPEVVKELLFQDGKNITADVRYTVPLRTGDNSLEFYTGLSFKQSNNNLTWDPRASNVTFGNTTDVFQLTTGLSQIRRDRLGAWAFGANATASPGRINSRNSDAAFRETRFAAKPHYLFASLSYQRLLNLPYGWDYTSRGLLQLADGNLLPSEQLTIGGASSVRGFNENVFAGDEGFVFTNELLTPAWKKSYGFLPKLRNTIETRFVAFYDAAHVRLKHSTTLDPQLTSLASVGVGLRMSLATNFSLSADYGWQLTYLPYKTDEHSRGHIKAMLAF